MAHRPCDVAATGSTFCERSKCFRRDTISARMGTAAPSPGSDPDLRTIDLALRRYDVVLRYLSTENSLYWTRSQFFLAANAGLLAFGLARLPSSGFTWRVLLPSAFITILGFALSCVWLLALNKASRYRDRWRNVCIALEPVAFGEVEIFRNVPRLGLGRLAKATVCFFLILWIVAACALLLLFEMAA